MRRIVSLLIVLSLMVLPFDASAQSIFAGTMSNAKSGQELPDYGDLMGVEPDEIQELDSGEVGYIYYDISQEDFDAFGVYLSEEGCALVSHRYEDDILLTVIEKNGIQFVVEYAKNIPALAVVYPPDAIPTSTGHQADKKPKSSLPDPFDGYIRVELGESFEVDGVGDFCISSFTPNGSFTVCNHIGSMLHKRISPKKLTVYTWLVCNYLNTSTDAQEIANSIYLTGLSVDGAPPVGSLAYVKFYYINEDGTYVYPLHAAGRYEASGAWGNTGEILTNSSDYGWVKPMEEADIGICFDLPKAVRESSDGIMAVTFEFLDSATPYVVYLRGEY